MMYRIKLVIKTGVCVSLLVFCGCSGEDEPSKIDCSQSDLAVTFDSTDPESCTVLNGSITTIATGGKAPYTYALNAGTFGSNAVFSQLSAGDYIIRVRDKNGCMVSTNEIALRIPGNDLAVTAVSEPDTECVGSNGTISVTATGGTEPYQYKIDNNGFGGSATFTSVGEGQHTITVRDAAGCLFPKPVSVSHGDTGTSLANEIMPIIEVKCAVTNCHNGSQEPNLSSPAAVRTNAAKIKTMTQSGEMPKEGSISSSQKAMIACWVDDGAKDN